MNIKVLIKHPGSGIARRTIPNTLEALQELVGGYIETVTVCDGLCLIVNEEGLLHKLPYNCSIRRPDGAFTHLFGTVVVVGTKGEEFTDSPINASEFAFIAYDIIKIIKELKKQEETEQ